MTVCYFLWKGPLGLLHQRLPGPQRAVCSLHSWGLTRPVRPPNRYRRLEPPVPSFSHRGTHGSREAAKGPCPMGVTARGPPLLQICGHRTRGKSPSEFSAPQSLPLPWAPSPVSRGRPSASGRGIHVPDGQRKEAWAWPGALYPRDPNNCTDALRATPGPKAASPSSVHSLTLPRWARVHRTCSPGPCVSSACKASSLHSPSCAVLCPRGLPASSGRFWPQAGVYPLVGKFHTVHAFPSWGRTAV